MQNEKCELEEEASAEPTRFAGAPEPTEASGNEIGRLARKREIFDRKHETWGGARRSRAAVSSASAPTRGGRGRSSESSNSFRTPPRTRNARSMRRSLRTARRATVYAKGGGRTPDHRGICIRYGESEPILIASMSSNLLWNMLTKEHYIPELKQEIERILASGATRE